MICRLGAPVLDHRVMAVAWMLWFVCILDRLAASLILFVRVFTPSDLRSNYTSSSGL